MSTEFKLKIGPASCHPSVATVYYGVMWKGFILEYQFADNAQYLGVVADAERGIADLMRQRGLTIPTMKAAFVGMLDELALTLAPLVEEPTINLDDVLPIWKDKCGHNYQEWFSVYHMLKKLKYVGNNCGVEQIYNYEEGETVIEEGAVSPCCEYCGNYLEINSQCFDCEICVPCGRCSKHFVRDPLIDWECHPQVCPPCVDYLLGDDEEDEEEEEPVVQKKKKNEKIGLCQVCETETHRRCSCKEIYYCSGDCQKTHWKTHKKNCKK